MEAVLICSTQSPKCLQTRRPLTDSGKNQLRASQSVGLSSPLHFPKSNAQSWPRSTRRLTIKNQEKEESKKGEDLASSTTPAVTFTRLFTKHDFLTQPPQTPSKDISAYKGKALEIKNIGMELIETGHMEEAEDLLREWCKIDQYQNSLEAMLAETLLYQGKYQQVVDLPLREIAPSDTLLLLKAVACALISDSYDEESTKWWKDFKGIFREKDPISADFQDLLNASIPDQSSQKLHLYTTKLKDLIKASKERTKQNKQPKESEGQQGEKKNT